MHNDNMPRFIRPEDEELKTVFLGSGVGEEGEKLDQM
jgi:hypothetical protein